MIKKIIYEIRDKKIENQFPSDFFIISVFVD